MNCDLEELQGDVDFDFFDSPKHARTTSPQKRGPTPDKVVSKPPVSPMSTRNFESGDLSEDGEKKAAVAQRGEPGSGEESSDPEYSSDSDESESDRYSEISSEGSKLSRSGKSPNKPPNGMRSRSRSRSLSDSGSERPKSRRTYNSSLAKSRDGRGSRSQSSGDSESGRSRSRDSTPTPRKSKRGKTVHSHSSSAYSNSDGESSPRPQTTGRPQTAHPSHRKQKQSDRLKQQAWGIESNKGSVSKGGERKENGKSKSKRSQPQKSEHSSDESDASSRSGGSESDSDMTDVSPLTSPRTRGSPNKKKNSNESSRKHDSMHNGIEKVQYREMPVITENDAQNRTEGGENIDLNILMKAVSDLEKQKRLKANTRRVMFATPKRDQGNYSFSNDRAKLIERENQRLLKEIIKQVSVPRRHERNAVADPLPVRRLTPSAVNRSREQRKIEMENLAMLKRLQTIKPTRGMARNEQLMEYQRTMLYGVPLQDVQEKKARSSYLGSSRLSQRSRSMSSVHSATTTASIASSTSSRRPQSAKKTPTDNRPQWCEKW